MGPPEHETTSKRGTWLEAVGALGIVALACCIGGISGGWLVSLTMSPPDTTITRKQHERLTLKQDALQEKIDRHADMMHALNTGRGWYIKPNSNTTHWVDVQGGGGEWKEYTTELTQAQKVSLRVKYPGYRDVSNGLAASPVDVSGGGWWGSLPTELPPP